MRMPWTCPNGYSDSRTLQPAVRKLNMFETAPDWTVREWLNTDRPLSLQDFQGKVIVIEAFQMLCPGCVSHGLPLAQKIRDTFGADQVAVIGIHTVFEHHDVQGGKPALEAFLHEYRYRFPVGIDRRNEGERIPATMGHYEMQGTPTFVLIDKKGRRRRQYFGMVSELVIGSEIGQLIAEPL